MSTSAQKLDVQVSKLREAGCDVIYSEKITGTTRDRRELKAAMRDLRPGDCLVVPKLDRLGRNMRDVTNVVHEVTAEKGAHIRVLEPDIDTTTPTGRIMISFFGLVAEMEHQFILDRTESGRQAAREQGRTGGRKAKLTDHQVSQLRKEHESGRNVTDLARAYGVSRPAVYRYLKGAN